jgi:hypothetical protein
MTNSAKRRGDDAERQAAAVLSDLLGFPIRRKLGAGRFDDVGDLDGLPQTTVQVAAWSDALRAIRQKPLDAERQREQAGSTFCVTLVRLRGGVWRVVLTPEQFATWAREALDPARSVPFQDAHHELGKSPFDGRELMPLLGRKKVRLAYEDLLEPSLWRMRIPPVQLMKRSVDSDAVNEIADMASRNLLSVLKSKPGGLSDALDTLVAHLRQILGESHAGAAFIGPGIGYIIGEMENQSGVEVAGQSEQHYVMALWMSEAQMPEGATASTYFGFACDCGYYLARTRDASLAQLCDFASSEVSSWREKGGAKD